MEKLTYYTYATAHGPLTLQASSAGIARVVFGRRELEGDCAPSVPANKAASQIQEYLARKRRDFDVPLDIQGTPFQIEVWQAVAAIPYGDTVPVRELAERLGRRQAYRSVGTALKAVPLPLLIPVHRVLGASQEPAIYRAFRNLEQD